MFNNLINGNLTDARNAARRPGFQRLREYAETKLGWSGEKAYFAARYLKGTGSFQTYCDAK